MATYPGMTLGGEVRESISLDEDDLSDVEDEVFIRDGKNGYKLAEEINVKRPLMAPRRKINKPNMVTRIKNRPPCKAYCKLCCYFTVALSALIGLLIVIVVLVSIFPLPLDKVCNWFLPNSNSSEPSAKLIPCSNLKVTDVWTVTLPKLTTDSPVRTVDVNGDGFLDILFGFGTGDTYNMPLPDIFCSVFMEVDGPCQGGVLALDGLNGNILWRYWTNDTIFHLQCSADINQDGLDDCLAIGVEGTIITINSKDGKAIWRQYNNRLDIFIANFIEDQNNDNISDILTSHTSLDDPQGHVILLSGKTGEIMTKIKTPYGGPTYFMPQLLRLNNSLHAIVGTGSPNSAGNLSLISLSDLKNGRLSTILLYQDKHKGILTQSVLVDITNDNVPDIITAMYNSSVVAIDGQTLKPIWTFSVPESETNIVPIPGYFNFDKIMDFLVIYQKYDDILKYNYTKAFILDGSTGKPIYQKPISDSISTQSGGLTLSMESFGYDMFVYWTSECDDLAKLKNTNSPEILYDSCHQQINKTTVLKLNALNQFNEPPGFEIYNSMNRTLIEFNNTNIPLEKIKEHLRTHLADKGQNELGENIYQNSRPIGIHKYGVSSFRHKDNEELNKAVPSFNDNPQDFEPYQERKYYDYNLPDDMENEYDDGDPKDSVFEENIQPNGRDPRSKISPESKPKIKKEPKNKGSSKKKNLDQSDYGVYDYKNVRMAKNELLHDLNNLPDDILKETYFKNMENNLRKSKFEQRDLLSHKDKIKDGEDVKKIIEEKKKQMPDTSFNLWNLETESEIRDRENENWRIKRETNYSSNESLRKVTSVGAVLDSFNVTNTSNSIDVVFVTYWQPARGLPRYNPYDEIRECIEGKFGPKDNDYRHGKMAECLFQLHFGQMTIYRIRLECECVGENDKERCAKFLPMKDQSWSSYLGAWGDGAAKTRQ